ncbi:MAG: hypothetical protein EPO36_08265 [Chloroflexota bacterium]|nr:MAG: hypothetical protein EPO36_08265 [Chloroflexota bacterium]
MALETARRAIARSARRAWAFFIDTVEWTSNGDRRRPKFAERSDIYDPTAGWGPPDTRNEGLEAERRGEQEA